MKSLKRIIVSSLKFICLIIVILIAIGNAIYIFRKNLDKTHIFTIGNFQFYIDETNAMIPTITKKDIMIIKSDKNYKQDDIVVFEQNGNLKIRRIMQNLGNNIENSFAVKGDNNLYNEPYEVNEKQIKGKVIKTINKMAFLVKIVQSKALLIINTSVLALIVYIKIKTNKNMKKRRIKQKSIKT